MSDLRILWRGKVPTRDISWRFHAEHSITLPVDLERKRQEVWKNALLANPEIYDGHLLVLLDVEATDSELKLKTTEITFSRMLTLEHSGVGLDGYGTLGIQALVLSRDKDHALVGQRSTRSMYCPGYWSTPGGMLEVSDVRNSFDSACMREISEEAKVEISPRRDAVALVKEVHGDLGSVILLTAVAQSAPDVNAVVPGNEEWEAHQLRWMHLDDIAAIPAQRSLEGVQFVASEWRRVENGEYSVLL